MAKKAKGQTIGIAPGLFSEEEVQAFIAEGYEVVEIPADFYKQVDVILAPKAWRMNDSLKPLVKLVFAALKNERPRRKSKQQALLDLGDEE